MGLGVAILVSQQGADMLKLLMILTILVGCVLETFGVHGLTTWMQTQ